MEIQPEDLRPHLDLTGRRVAVDPVSRRISVRVANFGEVHSGFGEEVRVPRNSNLEAAHVGTVDLSDGTTTRVAVLPMDTKHAGADTSNLHAAAWYENSGLGVARGRYSHDDDGIRFDGVLFDDIDDAKLDRLTAGSASGDWRAAIAIKKFSDYENVPCDFVGSCIVNIPGYSDTFRQAPAQRFALVASASGDLMSIETVESDMKKDPNATETEVEAEALTAGGEGEGCDGTCESCGCGAKGAAADADSAEPTVTLTASAAKHLLEVAQSGGVSDGHGIDTADVESALEEVTSVLTAGGFIEQPDPRDARLAALEAIVIQQAFRD